MLTVEIVEHLIQQRVAIRVDVLRGAGASPEEIAIETERLRRELEADYSTWLLRTAYPDIH